MSKARDPGAARSTAASEALTEDFPGATGAEDHPSWQSGGPFAAGDLVGARYRILRLVGQGGMGVVYEALDLELGEKLAVKVVRPEVSAQAQTLDRFRREISLARKVTHPNVCRIYDVGHHQRQDGGEEITFLTMELLQGETLATRLAKRGPLGQEEGLSIGCQIAAGLSSAHDAGVLHRDFKSSNVILAPASWGTRAVITDFGLSRTWAPVDEEASGIKLTGTGQLMGTPAYFAPEQLEGGDLTPATDIYAMGIVIYEMVTGSLPFTGTTPFLTALKRLRDAPTDPRTHAPGLDQRWVEVIDGCLQRDPGSRFAHARDILGILGTEHLSQGATTGLTLPMIRPSPAQRRWRAPLLIAALVLLAAAGWAILRQHSVAGDAATERLYVAILEPEIDPGSSPDVGFIASDLEIAVLRGLLTLDGLKPIDPDEVRELEGDRGAIARALAADELVATRAARMPAEWRIELRRIRGDDGTVLWAETLQAPTDEARLLATAVAAALRRGYPDHPPRPGVESHEVRAQDYATFVKLYRTVESPPGDVDWVALMEQLASLRSGSPRFLDTYLLEARLARDLYQSTREPDYLRRGFELIAFARDIAPRDPRPLFREVQLAVTADDLERAGRVLEELEELVPGDVDVLTARAHLTRRQGRPAEALKFSQRAYERRPTARHLYNLASIEIRLGRLDVARSHLQELIEAGYSRAESRLAELEIEKGDVKRAKELYQKIVDRSPEAAIPRSNLGLAQLFLGEYAEAAWNFRRAYDLTPKEPMSLLNLADCELLLGRLERATELYEGTLLLIDEGGLTRHWELLSIRAQALAHLGRTQEAVADVNEALQLSGQSAEASYYATVVFALAGERSSALVNAKRALDLGLLPRWFDLPWFDALRSDPEFQAMLAASAG